MGILAEIPAITPGVRIFQWTGVAFNDTLDSVFIPGVRSLTVGLYQDGGTFGDASFGWHGSMLYDVDAGFVALTDARSDTVLAQTLANKVDEILQLPLRVKPVVSGTSGSGLRLILVARF